MKSNTKKQLLQQIRNIAALLLWDDEAIQVNLDRPFKLVSGNYSPIYINCRKVISNRIFMHLFTTFALTIYGLDKFRIDVVAGGETAGIPFAAFVAQSFSLPLVYVRKAKKEYGVASLVEGSIEKGSQVLLVEDLITDAGSKMHFVEALKAVGATVDNVLVVFDREQGGKQILQKHGINLNYMINMSIALKIGEKANFLNQEDLELVKEYISNAEVWHKKQKLPFKEIS